MAYVLLFSSFAMAVAVVVMFIMPNRRRAAVTWALGAGFVTVFAIARLSPTNVPGGLGDEVELLPGIEETVSSPDMPDAAAVERILGGLENRLDPEVAAEVHELWSSGTGRFWLVSSSFDWIDASLFYAVNMTDALIEWSNEYAVVTTTSGDQAVIVFVEDEPGSLVLFALAGSGAPDTADTDASGGFEFG